MLSYLDQIRTRFVTLSLYVLVYLSFSVGDARYKRQEQEREFDRSELRVGRKRAGDKITQRGRNIEILRKGRRRENIARLFPRRVKDQGFSQY